MKNIGDIMKQAQKMQERLAEIQKELSTKTFEASSGGGMVTATVNGSLKLVGIKIDPQVVNPDDIAMLGDLITAAVNEALKRGQEAANEEMSKATAGLGLNIPGMF